PNAYLRNNASRMINAANWKMISPSGTADSPAAAPKTNKSNTYIHSFQSSNVKWKSIIKSEATNGRTLTWSFFRFSSLHRNGEGSHLRQLRHYLPIIAPLP